MLTSTDSVLDQVSRVAEHFTDGELTDAGVVKVLTDAALTGATFGGYTAKNCPEAEKLNFRMQNGLLDPDLATDFPAAVRERMESGNRFEAERVGPAVLKAAATGEYSLEFLTGDRSEESKAARAAATVQAMADGVDVIWNARFPRDVEAHTSLEPDMLVRSDVRTAAGAWVYYPVDVKDHAPTSGTGARRYRMSTLTSPGWEHSTETDFVGNAVAADSVQLAAYARQLQRLGHGVADGEASWGAIIGRPAQGGDLSLVWRRLDQGLSPRVATSALQKYDTSFSQVLDIIARDIVRDVLPMVPAHPADHGPQYTAACKECPMYANLCGPALKDTDHITLLPGVTPARAQAHYGNGITTISQIANLDIPTAMAVDTKSELPDRADEITAAYADRGVWRLTETIDRARVRKAEKVHRVRGLDTVTIPRAAIELDFDVEDIPVSTLMGAGIDPYEGDAGLPGLVETTGVLVYMIGIKATGRRVRNGQERTRSEMNMFSDYTGTFSGEREVFRQAWEYLQFMQAKARLNKWSIRAFHYTGHERHVFRSLAERHAGHDGIPTVAQVEEFFDSDMVVDLHKTIDTQLLWPCNDTSLKTIAQWCRFDWEDTDPSGGNSIAWVLQAINGPADERADWAARVEAYNTDDVSAQLAIREYLTRLMSGSGSQTKLPGVETLDRRFGPRRRR